MNYKNYSKTIFGRKFLVFDGVEQGFDPCSEPDGRVQFSLNIDYYNGNLCLRDGYKKAKEVYGESILNITLFDFSKNGSIIYLTGSGNAFLNDEV